MVTLERLVRAGSGRWVKTSLWDYRPPVSHGIGVGVGEGAVLNLLQSLDSETGLRGILSDGLTGGTQGSQRVVFSDFCSSCVLICQPVSNATWTQGEIHFSL